MGQKTNKKNWSNNFSILWSGQFFTIIGLTGITPFLPFYISDLGVNSTSSIFMWSGFALAAPAISYAITTPLWGKLNDRWSRKWMVVRSLLGLAISLWFMGLAQTPVQLFLARICQGAFGGIMDASTSYIGSEAPKEQQGKYLGKLQKAVAAGSFIGPLMGGTIGDMWGFRPLLIVMGLLTGVCALISAIFLQEEKRTQKKIILSSGVWDTFKELLSDHKTKAFIFAGIVAKFGVFGLITVFGPFVQTIVTSSKITTTWVGALDAATYLGALFGATWWGKQNDRKSIEQNYILATVLCGICIIPQAFVHSVEWLFILRICQGFFYSALIQSVILTVIRSSGNENRGVRIGTTNSLLMIGQVSGSILGGMLGGFVGFGWTIIIMGSAFVMGSVWLFTMKKGAVTTTMKKFNEKYQV